jgi:hypothetical protein
MSTTRSTGTALELNLNICGKDQTNDRLWRSGSEERAYTRHERKPSKHSRQIFMTPPDVIATRSAKHYDIKGWKSNPKIQFFFNFLKSPHWL